VLDSIEVNLRLLNNKKLSVNLFVIKDQAFTTNIILGRDFIAKQNLTVIFRLCENKSEEKYNKLSLFAEQR